MPRILDAGARRSLGAPGASALSALPADMRAMLLRRPGASAGRVVPVIPETDFQFDGRNTAGVEQQVVLAERIDATHFNSAALVVRFHTKGVDGNWSSSSCTAEVRAYNMSFAEEEPHTLFAESTARATVQILNGHTAPRLYVTSLTAPIAAELRVVLVWIQGTVASSSSEKLSVAVELVGRE